jgi:hypothetical protein
VKRALGIGSGLVGAASVTFLNHLAKRYLPAAPLLDILGLRLATVAFNKAGIEPPRGFPLKIIALIGALITNSIFYGLVGLGKPRGDDTTARTPMAKAGTIAWYVLGGLLAALAFAVSHANREGGTR